MPSPIRLLGFAFAGADLLIELDDRWRVTYAAGAPPGPGRSTESLTALNLDELLTPASTARLAAALSNLTAGRRLEPVKVSLLIGDGKARPGMLRAVMLPELAPCVSCAIEYAGPPRAIAEPAPDIGSADDFADRARDILTRSHATATPLSLAMVQVSGLDEAAPQGATMLREIEALLQSASVDGEAAGRIAEQRYALLREPGAPPLDLRESLISIGARFDQSLEATVSQVEVAAEIDPMASLRALRFTLDAFMDGRAGGDEPAAMTFTGAVMRTLQEASDFRALVAERRFDLCYQPVVDLKSGAVHHYEVLARFAPDTSPAAVIRMAEEMALITDFDLAVADRSVRALRDYRRDELRLAVNVSGRSLSSDRFASGLLALTAADPGMRPRLTLEVTESAAMVDIAAADARLQALRSAGFKVAIDDFGAGAASFDYLRRLSVDAVKIDGRYVQGAAGDPRAQKLIEHLVGLCRSLKLETVAEMVEDEEVAGLMRRLGVDHGQGWHFGRPGARPATAGKALAEPLTARRRGVVESWG